jgi:protein-S-isoprenylcysteine O-methyltransferase Ste14
VLGLAAVGALERRGTLIDPRHPGKSTALVTDGPFARTRNPMYLSLTILLLAHAVHRRSLRAVLPVVGFVTTLNRTQIPREEHALRGRFGRKYRRYAQQTPRWVRRRP